jgi:chemotaxis response regulator CheB
MTLIAIGSSAGGPAALAAVLSGLPRDLPAAIVLVQHLDENMAGTLAEYLLRHSAMPVRVAIEGERIVPGTALLAGTNDHLVLKARDRVGYTKDPVQCVYRPSVDAFFDSVTKHWKGDVIGVVLTGMGRDGAAGLRRLRDVGRHTIAQDQQSSVVYGMPKAAAAIDAAVEVLPLDQIASRLVHLVENPQ